MRLYFILLLFFALNIQAQNDLRLHKNFFQDQFQEYTNWMKKVNLDVLVSPEKMDITADKITFHLKSTFITDDSLQVVWKDTQKQYFQYTKERIGERMFDQLAFLCDLELNQLEIRIQGNEFQSTSIRITHDGDYLQVEENFSNVFTSNVLDIASQFDKDSFVVPIKKLKVNAVVGQDEDNKQLISLKEIRRYIGDYLQAYYASKGTRWYNAHIDTSRTYYNKIIYRITCLNNEMIQDGYFEYIQLKVELAQQGENIHVKFDVLGKYAAGFFCPEEQTKFYKSMETYYPTELMNYTEEFYDKLENHLRKYP